MGRSTTALLIANGKAESKYHLSGINSDGQWISFFMDALNDLVDDLGLTDTHTFTVLANVNEYTLPEDFYSTLLLFDGSSISTATSPFPKRRNYNAYTSQGYWVLNKGAELVMDVRQIPVGKTLTLLYQKYATALTESGKNSEHPEVPTVGEKALIYYALTKALRNNSHLDDAKEYERLYEAERLKIRTAAARGGG